MNTIFASMMTILALALTPIIAERGYQSQLSGHIRGRALLVGVNHYRNFPNRSTPGSEEDAAATRDFIREHYGFQDGEIRILLGEEATAGRIESEFRSWLIAGTRPGDRVFFLYSGHGTRVPDDNGDEADGEDEALAPYDVDRYGNNIIRDDVFNQLIGELSGRMVVMVFDACHSGTISRGMTGGTRPSTPELARHPKYLPSPTEFAELASRGGERTRSVGGASMAGDEIIALKQEPGKARDLFLVVDKPRIKNTGVIIFSAAQSGQRAFPIEVGPKRFRGALSYAFTLAQLNDYPTLRQLKQRIAERILTWQNIEKRLFPEQQPVVEVIGGTNAVSLEDQPLFGAAQVAQVLAEGNPGSEIKVNIAIDQKKSSFSIGENISYQVKTSKRGYLYIVVFSEQNVATCIFPNRANADDVDNFVGPGTHRIPRSKFFKAQEPVGRDVVIAILSESKLKLGDKEDLTWNEVFERLENKRFFEYVKTRGIGSGDGATTLGQTDWQAASLLVETVRRNP